MSGKLKVLIVDDSAITRGLFEKAFTASPDFFVAGMVSNGRKAVDFCRQNAVDVVVCDLSMPEMDGTEATRILSGDLDIPVVLYSEHAAEKPLAEAAGAALFLKKPSLVSYNADIMREFAENVKRAVGKSPKTTHTLFPDVEREPSMDGGFAVLCIGASTGGPSAVQEVLLGLGNDFPLPVLYVQHLDVGADGKMASWFDQTCPNISVSLAQDGDVALPGHVYLAPADTHLVIDRVKGGLPVMRLSDEPPERFLRPAVNKLFRSAAKHYKKQCLAVLMTGMGRDGAEGCKEIVGAGGYTICEDKSTCTVFGMPAAAIELGAATKVLPRTAIAKAVLKLVK